MKGTGSLAVWAILISLCLTAVSAPAADAPQGPTFRNLTRKYFKDGDGKALAELVGFQQPPQKVIALKYKVVMLARDDDGKAVDRVLWSMHPEVKVFLPEGIGFAPYRVPGSEDLADVTLAALADHRLALWAKHGCVAVGRNLLAAFDLIDVANKGAELYLLCKSAGVEPEGLSEDELKALALAHRGIAMEIAHHTALLVDVPSHHAERFAHAVQQPHQVIGGLLRLPRETAKIAKQHGDHRFTGG